MNMSSSNHPARSWSLQHLWSEHRMSLAIALVCVVCLSAASALFAARLETRSSHASEQAGTVAKIWGGPLEQPQPAVGWRRVDAASIELAGGELSRSEVDVELDAEYRRRGIVEYPGYRAKFVGRYDFANPTSEPVFAAFSIGLPARREVLMLSGLKLLVNGEEDPAGTEYTPDRVLWTGRVNGNEVARFTFVYQARGLERFSYALSAGDDQGIRPVSGLRLSFTVRGARGELDRPIGSMSPTEEQPFPGGARWVWNVDRLLSAFDVGVVLPDTQGVSLALKKLTWNATWLYLLYAVGLMYALTELRPRARTLSLAGLSVAYALSFPLATYLAAYMAWQIACALTLLGIGGLSVFHAYRFVGRRSALFVGLCQILFLAVPTAAYLRPAHTGLILVLGGFAALAIGLHVVGTIGHRMRGGDEEPGSAEAAEPYPALSGSRS
jgi:hypothetical protein